MLVSSPAASWRTGMRRSRQLNLVDAAIIKKKPRQPS
jgi:hypothetical protein